MGRRGAIPTPASERFHSKYEIDPVTGCWNWTAARGDHGYGTIGETVAPMKRKTLLAHRLSYEMHKGPIPEGLVVDHICNNRGCVNPDHLQAITNLENINRSPSPEVQRRLANRCIRGHDLTDPEILYIRPDTGRRQCKACILIRDEAARRRAGIMPRKLGVECGTYSGAIAHYRRKEPVCDPCKAAHAEYRRDYQRRKQAS